MGQSPSQGSRTPHPILKPRETASSKMAKRCTSEPEGASPVRPDAGMLDYAQQASAGNAWSTQASKVRHRKARTEWAAGGETARKKAPCTMRRGHVDWRTALATCLFRGQSTKHRHHEALSVKGLEDAQ